MITRVNIRLTSRSPSTLFTLSSLRTAQYGLSDEKLGFHTHRTNFEQRTCLAVACIGPTGERQQARASGHCGWKETTCDMAAYNSFQ
eukprot:5874430-Pyramimonas_sp.AAC.1